MTEDIVAFIDLLRLAQADDLLVRAARIIEAQAKQIDALRKELELVSK